MSQDPQKKPLPSVRSTFPISSGEASMENADNDSVERSLMHSSRKIIGVGMMIVAILVLGFGIWASLAPLASGVIAQGVITADGERSTVQHLDGGIVKEILVTEGQTVKAGQVLIRLDGVQAQAKLSSLQAEYDGYQARYARLQAEQSNAETISFPAALTSRMQDSRVKEIMHGEVALFNERHKGLQNELEMTEKTGELYTRNISGTKAQLAANKSQLLIIKEELTGLEKLFAKGYVSYTRILKLKREKAQLDGDVGQKESNVAQGLIKILESKVEANKIKTNFRKDVTAEFREVQGQMFDLEEQIRGLKDTLTRLDIVAPKAGAVLDLQIHAKNAVLLPGHPVLDIVPTGKVLVVEAKIQPTDIDNILVGAETEIRFPAFRQRTTPSILGTVSTVGADTLVDTTTGATYYTARIIVSQKERDRLADKDLVPGMPANVTIRSGERTLIEYMVEPLTDVIALSFKE